MFFRIAAPIIMFFATLFYVFVSTDPGYTPLIQVLIAAAMGYLGFYLPNVFIAKPGAEAPERRSSSRSPTRSTCC